MAEVDSRYLTLSLRGVPARPRASRADPGSGTPPAPLATLPRLYGSVTALLPPSRLIGKQTKERKDAADNDSQGTRPSGRRRRRGRAPLEPFRRAPHRPGRRRQDRRTLRAPGASRQRPRRLLPPLRVRSLVPLKGAITRSRLRRRF